MQTAAKNILIKNGGESAALVAYDAALGYSCSCIIAYIAVLANNLLRTVEELKTKRKRMELFKNFALPLDDVDHNKLTKIMAANAVITVSIAPRISDHFNVESVDFAPWTIQTTRIWVTRRIFNMPSTSFSTRNHTLEPLSSVDEHATPKSLYKTD